MKVRQNLDLFRLNDAQEYPAMIKQAKKIIQTIRDKPIGCRFLYGYLWLNHHSNQRVLYKIMLITLSILFIIIGIILLFIPGPGMLFIFIGVVLLAMTSKKMAKFLDACEIKIRNK